MSGHPIPPSGGHLDYYIKHGISPVRYRTDDFGAHLDRRDSLYRSLGLPPIAFKGSHVLEVAPGSGQNSLYTATCLPASLTLVEPNPSGQADIATAFRGLELPHTNPNLIPDTLQNFEPERQFDIVLCENWLGGLPEEVSLIQKLASLVAPGGVQVMTMVPLSGFFPNVMRKLLSLRLVPDSLDFESRTTALVDIFGPHLSTIANMTRSHRDWVQDCMINPHYLNVGLPLATVLEAIGGEMEVLATFPRYAADWRWFKGLSGENRRFNEHLAEAESANLLSFIDSGKIYPSLEPGMSHTLREAFGAVHSLALSWQAAHEAGAAAKVADLTAQIGNRLEEIERRLTAIDSGLGSAIAELRAVWAQPQPSAGDVRDMRAFAKLFGRETVYISLTRPLSNSAP